jgi:lipoate-protein ligase A
MSGGGAVYHDEGNLNYCFIKNRVPGKFPLNSEFLQSIVQVMIELYIPVSVGKRNDIWLPGGYKISGTASHVGKYRELHHGTLLYDSNLDKLQKALSPKISLTRLRTIASVPSPVKNIRTFLAEQNNITPSVSEFFQLFIRKLLKYFSLDSLSALTEKETLQIQKIEADLYESSKWTFKK